MSEEDISQKCGLKNVDETRNYFINPWNTLFGLKSAIKCR